MPILTLEKDGSIQEHGLGTMGGIVMPKRPTLEDARFFCPHVDTVECAVYVMMSSLEVVILKGGYVIPFLPILNRKFPGWKLKAA